MAVEALVVSIFKADQQGFIIFFLAVSAFIGGALQVAVTG
jgi:hypothetical protein